MQSFYKRTLIGKKMLTGMDGGEEKALSVFFNSKSHKDRDVEKSVAYFVSLSPYIAPPSCFS